MFGDREAYWFGHVRKWAASGQSVASYVGDQGLSRSCFYTWRQRFQGQEMLQVSEPTPVFQQVEVIQDLDVPCPAERSPLLVSPLLSEPPVDQAVVAKQKLRPCATLVLASNSQHKLPSPPSAVTALVRLPNGVAVKLSGGLRLPDLETVLRQAAALP